MKEFIPKWVDKLKFIIDIPIIPQYQMGKDITYSSELRPVLTTPTLFWQSCFAIFYFI